VGKAAAKCLRFGWDRDEPDYGRNDIVLAAEVGDLLAVIDVLPLDLGAIAQTRSQKVPKAERMRRIKGRIMDS
jgi:hypothetical protein